MYLLILYLPLYSALCAGLLGRYIGYSGSKILTCLFLFVTFLVSLFSLVEVGFLGSPVYIELFEWFSTGLFSLVWGFQFDSLTVIMLVVVTSVSFLVHVYSTSYMDGDPHLPRFMSYLSLFTFFMIILVTGDNFFQLFIGWEGVGLCSYLLINFWWTRLQANKSAIKAMVVNRIGDVGLGLRLFLTFVIFKSLNYSVVFPLVSYGIYFGDWLNGYSITMISLLFFVGAIGKSAQLGLHTWLPDAMEGPTPVSALIHAATMVTAGVFLLIRSSYLIEYSGVTLVVIAVVGSLTSFFAATIGVVQNDLKKVIAYSTCSQLGYMVFSCGLSSYSVGLFHLMNHAFFKALLFLSARSIIHALGDEQDMRKMGRLIRIVPFTYSMVVIGSLSLMGFPYLTGFYSKDVIIELSYAHYSIQGTFAHWLGSLSAFFTAFYSFRLIFLVFVVNYNGSKRSILGAHEGNLNLLLPLFVLSWGSIFIGYIFKDMTIGVRTPFWNGAIYESHESLVLIDAEFLPSYVKLLPVCLSLLGAFVSFFFYCYQFDLMVLLKKSVFGQNLYRFFNQKWYVDSIYNFFVVRTIVSIGHNTTYKLIDRGLLEQIGPTGIRSWIESLSLGISNIVTGNIYHYSFMIFIGSVAFLVIHSIFGSVQLVVLVLLLSLYVFL